VVPGTGETTIFVYDAGGKVIAEYSTNVVPVQDAKVAYLTNDNLGTPRINTDANGGVIARHDYMPFGEEIDSLGGRSATDNYVVDDVRQGFTGYFDDEETGLDFAEARMYAKTLGRFNGSDPILSTGSAFNPKSWNRYSYSLNNPLLLKDPYGMYTCSDDVKGKDSCSSDNDKKFEAARQLAIRDKLAQIEKRYGEGSTEYQDALKAVNSYGDAGKANGIVVGFGTLDRGVLGETTGSLDKFGNKSVNVTIDLNQNKNSSDFLLTVAHEGSHVRDHLDYQGRLIALQNSSDANAIMAVVANAPTHGFSETRAFGVSSVFAEFTIGGNSNAPIDNSMGGVTFTLGGDPEKSIAVGGQEIWKSSWKNLDIKTIEGKRRDAIASGLKNDKHYGPLLNTPIEK